MARRDTKRLQAGQVVTLLASRHSKDLFIPECKDGPTVYGPHSRIDAWAMRRSWAKPCFSGYEIKVSRSDFLRDDKWTAYLALCNEFWFVCPYGLIAPDEVPEGVGLLWASKNTTRLYAKRKAAHREIEPPIKLLLYILMSRVRPLRDDEYSVSAEQNIEYWRRWLATKKEKRDLGRAVSQEIRRLVKERIHEQECENHRLESDLASVRELRDRFKDLGLLHTITSWRGDDEVRRRVRAALNGVAHQVQEAIRRLTKAAEHAERVLTEALDDAT